MPDLEEILYYFCTIINPLKFTKNEKNVTFLISAILLFTGVHLSHKQKKTKQTDVNSGLY